MIVTRTGHAAFAEIFGNLFGEDQEQEMMVVKASPDLILRMSASGKEAKSG